MIATKASQGRIREWGAISERDIFGRLMREKIGNFVLLLVQQTLIVEQVSDKWFESAEEAVDDD